VCAHDRELGVGARIVDPVIQAAPLERVVDVARAVRGQHDDRFVRGAQRAQLGDRDLELGQQLEQEALELLVGAVDLVDQQHGRRGVGEVDRAEQRAAEQHVLAIQRREVVAPGLKREQLARIVPLVGGLGEVEALVALQPDELDAERVGEHAGEQRLAHAGRAFEEQRPLHAQRQVRAHRERVVDDIAARGEIAPHGVGRAQLE
jgi:hypothetical protein